MTNVLNMQAINKKDLLGTVALLATMVLIAVSAQMGVAFDIHKVVPGISTAAALVGLKKAYSAYKAGKGAKKAIAVIFGWNVIGLLVSLIGDWAIGYLLEHHIEKLASY
ncbi:hypothetical protein [Alkalihalobacillus sp. CinArs1]|uniref:hypothetical protein n=1 Tax=Alkalihalobacillus sp. CinArs1 TaxID=2995314 RepID=UPI0022DE203E|nr:hypothetical protein [Alkalihalobacillus sp. CinArs1]